MFKWKLLMSVMLMALMIIGCTATPKDDDDDGDDDKKTNPTVVTYTVTFNSNGGSDVSSATVSSGEKVTKPADPTRSGFEFVGWYKEDTFATEWNFTTDTVTGNITLYAKWVAVVTYTVTFNSNGGSAVSSTTVSSGSKVTRPVDPALSGFTFRGWYKEDTFATEWNFTSDTVTGNLILYAKWAQVGSISLAESKVMVTVNSTGKPAKLQGRSVTLTPFSMGKYEVAYILWWTVKEWATSNGYTFQNGGMEGSVGTGGYPNFTNIGAAPTSASGEPVTMVSWGDCIVWCNAYSEMNSLTPCYKTSGGEVIRDSRYANSTVVDAAVLNLGANGYRLPTEAEWEYAASYKDGTNWTASDCLSGAAANYEDDNASLAVGVFHNRYDGGSWTATGVTKTDNVGTKTANALGLFDMSGNVYEWCSDWCGSITAGTPVTDPTGAGTGTDRLIRGGAWNGNANGCLVGGRCSSTPDYRGDYIGFRVSRSAN